MFYLLSIIFGLVPDVLYFTLFLIFTKNLKEKRLKLFLLISISYFLCILVQMWQFIFYMLFMICIYLSLKLLYKRKTQIIDIFVIGISYLWQTILSGILLICLKNNILNYYILYVIIRIILFMPFIFKDKFNLLYKKYCKFWNRNDKEKRPIKSVTLRNISLILFNSLIFVLNLTIINIINFYK